MEVTVNEYDGVAVNVCVGVLVFETVGLSEGRFDGENDNDSSSDDDSLLVRDVVNVFVSSSVTLSELLTDTLVDVVMDDDCDNVEDCDVVDEAVNEGDVVTVQSGVILLDCDALFEVVLVTELLVVGSSDVDRDPDGDTDFEIVALPVSVAAVSLVSFDSVVDHVSLCVPLGVAEVVGVLREMVAGVRPCDSERVCESDVERLIVISSVTDVVAENDVVGLVVNDKEADHRVRLNSNVPLSGDRVIVSVPLVRDTSLDGDALLESLGDSDAVDERVVETSAVPLRVKLSDCVVDTLPDVVYVADALGVSEKVSSVVSVALVEMDWDCVKELDPVMEEDILVVDDTLRESSAVSDSGLRDNVHEGESVVDGGWEAVWVADTDPERLKGR